MVVVFAFAIGGASGDGEADHGKIMGCYYGSWAFYRLRHEKNTVGEQINTNELLHNFRPGYGKFDVPDIDPTLCTHGFYGFADIDDDTYEIRVWDPWFDLNNTTDCDPADCRYDSYRRFVALKERNSNFVPMISIGKW